MRLGTALRLGRVSNLPTTWTNVAAGVALSGAQLGPAQLALACGAISLMYVGGMYLNDFFDREIDARERPDRPIPAGQASATLVAAAGFGMLALGAGLATALGLRDNGPGLGPGLAALGLCATIVAYNMHHKQNPLSPLLMGLCRVLVYVVAALSASGELPPLLWIGAGALLSYLIGLTYAAKQEHLNRVRSVWPLAFLAAPFAYVPALSSAVGAVLYLVFAAWVSYALSRLLRTAARNVPLAIGNFLAGICLLDAVLISGQGHVPLAIACASACGLTWLLQRVVPGT